MRIAIVAPPWVRVPPARYGGTELVIDGLCRGLQASGNDVLLCTTGDSTCPVPRTWTYSSERGTEQTDSATELAHVLAGYAAIARWDADIIHDHTLVGPFVAMEYATAPVVTTNHGPFRGAFSAMYHALSEHVPTIAISRHQAADASGVSIAAVIHHGVDVTQFPVGRGDGGYAAFIGRMTREKGVDHAIRIARAARMPLRIAAKMHEPAERRYYDEVVSPLLANGSSDVEYIGEVDQEGKQALLADATCLLNPICWPEPFGMVMVEALACGTPVVGTPFGAAPEIIGHGETGYLHTETEDLAAALVIAEQLDRSACRRSVASKFSVERMAADHMRVYQALTRAPARTATSSPAATATSGAER